MIKILLVTGIIAFILADRADAQIKEDSRTAFMNHFVTLDVVIENRNLIDISEAQKNTIQNAVKSMQAIVSDLSWEHEGAAQQLERLSDHHPVDQKVVTAQARKLMEIETQLKLENLKLHITIKNTLTKKQYTTLQGLLQDKNTISK